MAGLIRKLSRELRRKKEGFKQQIALSVAAGLLLVPFSAQASDIAKQDSKLSNTIQQNGKVYNIYADKVKGDVAFSEYSKFQLTAGEIANLRFRELSGTSDANNLLNVVNSSIDVQGTINAIRNNAVGGNLFFISEKGMTVGAGGVINAGSINIITPTGSAVELIKEHFGEGGSNCTQLPERLKNGYYAINPSGTIQVAGQLNTVDGITMQAGTITIKGSAALKSVQEMDYTNVVNIGDLNSGITNAGKLTASENEKGDIVLSAVAESTSATEEEREEWGTGLKEIVLRERTATVTTEEGSSLETRGAAKITAEASNQDDVWRSSEGPDSIPELLGTVFNPLGQITKVSAKIDVGGEVKGSTVAINASAYNQYNSLNDTSKWRDISQDIKNIDKFNQHYDWVKKLSDTLGVDVMYSFMASEAKVDVQSTAAVTATGANIDTGKVDDSGNPVLSPALSITASSQSCNLLTAQTKTEAGADYQKKDAKRAGEDYTANVISEEYNPKRTVHYGSLSVVYAGGNTDAAVNIQGTVTAEQGSANIVAASVNAFNVRSVVNTVTKSTTATDSRIDAAIGIAVTDNNASVSVGEGASVTAQKSLNVTANAVNSHDMGIQAMASAGALVATAVGVMEEQSKADVTLDGALTATEGSLGITASNTVSRNNLSVTNSFTGRKPAPAATDNVNANGDIEIEMENMPKQDGVNALLRDIQEDVNEKTAGTNAVTSNPDTARGLSDYFKAGASIGVSVENNDSNISIGETASISSGTALSVNALTDLQDTHMMSIGSLVNANPNATSLVNADAAALVTVFDNNAAITVAAGTSDQHASVSGGSVSMQAKVNEAYGRNKGVVNDFEKIYADLVSIKDLVQDDDQAEYDKTVEEVGTAINDIRLAVKKMTGLDIDDYIGNTVTIPTNVTDAALDVMALASGIEKCVESGKNGFRNEYNTITATINNNLMQFVRPETYVNFIAASSSNSVGAADPVFPQVGDISLAGAVNVNVLGNHATVDVGKYAEIKASAGRAAIAADAEQNTVAMNGRPNIDININPMLDLLYGNNSAQKRAALAGVNGKQGRLNLINQIISVRPNESGTNAIGGTVGVMEASTAGKVNIGDYAKITGYSADSSKDSILIKANDETVLTDITFGAGVSGKVGFEGMFGWLGGNIDTGVNMGQGVTLEAKSADTTPAYGNVRVESDVNAVMTNLVGEISITNGMAVGMSAGITDYSVNNIVNLQEAAEEGVDQAPVTIAASGLDVAALTDGVINTISLAGTVAIDQNVNKNTQQNDKIDAIENAGNEKADEAARGADKGVENGVILTDNRNQQNEEMGSAKDALLGKEPTQAPRLNIAGSGSAAVNIVNARTEANLNNVEFNVKNTVDEAADITVKAEDASFVGAWSGSTAVTWKKTVKLDGDNQLANGVANDPDGRNEHRDNDGLDTKEKDANKSVSVAFAGAVAVNTADQTVQSSIRNSTLKQVADIRNTAEKDGALVAAGIAASVSKTTGSESLSFDGAASASYNKGDGTVTALLENNTVNSDGEAWSSKTNIQNLAMISDTDVAGGIDLTLSLGGKYGFGAGGSLSVSDITNTLSAEAKGGTYYDIGAFQNHAAADLTAVATAVATSASAGSSGFNFDAALALNHLDNTANASINAGEGSSIIIKAGSVDVAAYDANNLNKSFDQYISDSYLDPAMDTYLQEVGSDVADKTGTDSATGGVEEITVKSGTASDGTQTDTPTGYTINPIDVSDGGTDIGTVALSISAGTKSVGVNAAAAVGLISNNFTADVTNAQIEAQGAADSDNAIHGLDVSANADSLLVNISGGVAASGGTFNGAGSVSVQQTEDTVSAVVEKSTIVTPALDIKATTGNRNVNLAGQVSAGSYGGGLAITYNSLNNNTVANLLSSDVSPAGDSQEANAAASGNGQGVKVGVTASNDGQVYSVAFGVGAGSTAGLNGSISMNFGKDNIEARIGESSEKGTSGSENGTSGSGEGTSDSGDNTFSSVIKDASAISVLSEDKSRKLSVAGGVSGAGTAAVGGSVAYNEIGDYSADEDHELKEKQVNRAVIEKTEITTQDAVNTSVTVKAKDESYLDTASAAAGGAGSAAVEGAATVSRLGRITKAEISGTDLDKGDTSERSFAGTEISADSSGHIFNSAIMIAGSGGASVGAGVSVMEDSADVAASLSDSTVHAGDLSVQATAKDSAFSVGVGGSGGMYAGVAGSVAVNLLNGRTEANIEDSEVTSENNVSVAAMSDTSLDNYAGTATFAATGGALGVSVSVNDIQNETSAGISGSDTKILAKSSGAAVKLADTVNDSEIINTFINVTGNMAPTFPLERTDTEYKGVTVSSSATNKINSLLVNAGFVAEGGQVTGTVNVNLIGGKTEASVTGGSQLTAENDGDVAVVAHDYANSSAFTGAIGGAAIGASIGLASNTNQITRDTVAAVTGPETADTENQITAQDLRVEAEAKRGIGSVDAGGAVAAVGAALGNTDDVTLLNGKTKAEVSRTTANLSGNLSVAADHNASIHTLSDIVGVGAVGADVGLIVDVIQDESNVETVLEQDTVRFTDNGNSSVAISATNKVTDDYMTFSIGASGIGASVNAAVSVGNSNSTVSISVENSDIGTSEKRAKDFDVSADNSLNIIQDTWNNDFSGIGGGEGLGVNVMTVDSTTATSLVDSSLYASGNIMVKAVENRSAHNLNGNTMGAGIEAAGVNVSVMTVGREVQNQYEATTYTADGKKAEIDSGANLDTAYGEGQAVVDGNTFKAEYAYGYVAEDSAATKPAVLGRGGAAAAQHQTQSENTGDAVPTSMVTASVSGGVLDSQQTVTLKSEAETNAEMQAMDYGAGPGVSFSGSVAVLDADRNAETRMDGVTVRANDIQAGSYLSGKTDMDIYQGGLSGVAAGNGAFGFVDNGGSARMNIGNNNILTAGNSIQAEVNDTTDVAVDVFSVAAAVGGAGGIQVSSVEANGRNVIAIGTANRFTANTISVDAKNTPVLTSHANGINGSVLIAGNVSVATAEAGKPEKGQHLRTALKTGDGNVFNAGETGNISLKADTVITTEATMKALDVSGLGSLLLNFNDSNIYSDTLVKLGKNTYVADKLTVSASTNATEDMNAAGVTVSVNGVAAFAVANNSQDSVNRINTMVSAAGTADASGTESGEPEIKTKINNAEIGSSSTVNVTGDAQSYGGALTGIGTAAELDFDLTTNTTAALKGVWNLDGELKVSALNSETLDLGVDTTAAAIIDASAALLDSTVDQKAGVSVSGATVTTGKDQVYTANNQMTGNKMEVKASGYGGLDVAASSLDQNHSYTGTVDISDNSNLSSAGSVKAGASTTGNFTTDNTVQAAGVVPLVFADSDHYTTYNNSVTVTDSDITTTKADSAESFDNQKFMYITPSPAGGQSQGGHQGALAQNQIWNLGATDTNVEISNDIILSTSEDTTLSFTTLGDNQFGVVGASSSSVDNTLKRTGTVSIAGASNLTSAGDIMLYAGKDVTGSSTSLDFTVVSDSYNTSIVPVDFSTELVNDMEQNNTVTVGSAVKGTSAGDIYITANSGKTKLYQDADNYNIWSGYDHPDDSGIVTTTGNAYPANETVSNSVAIDGTLTAGIHNALGISITGNPTYDHYLVNLVEQYNNTTDAAEKEALKQQILAYDENQLIESLNYDSVHVTVTDGGDWFDAGTVTPETITLENGYYSRYTQLKQDLQNSMGTDYYANYQAEMDSLLAEMAATGFADAVQGEDGTTQYIVFKQRKLPGIDLPDLQVSGGDVRIETPKLTVNNTTGSVTAKGNPKIQIDSASELYLKVNNAVIDKNGGNVYLNDSKIDSNTPESNGLSGVSNIHAESSDNDTSSISITSTAANTDPLLTGDIGIYGKVINNSGNVKIENDNYSIYVTETGAVSGQSITIQADNGSVVQNKPDGTITVGSNPISQWVIDNDTATRLQTVLSDKQNALSQTDAQAQLNVSFADYASYKEYVTNLDGGTNVGLPDSQPGTERSNGIVAGGAIYISGHDVNLNGLVQSGYGSYKVVLDDASVAVIDSLDAGYSGGALTDAQVMSDPQYRVVEPGAVYDTDLDQYVYRPGIYYNPSTKKLLADSVSSAPGQVYISGNIINTGNTGTGRVYAADGTSNISIDTTAIDRDLKVYNLTTSSGSGFVSITDHLQGKVFGYENGESRSYEINATAKPDMTEDSATAFTPAAKTTLQWTGSVSFTEVATYSYDEDTYVWVIDTKSDTDIIDAGHAENVQPTTIDVNGDTLENGSYLKGYENGKPNGMYPDDNQTPGVFGLIGSQVQTGDTVKGSVYKETGTDILWGLYKHVTYTWDESTPKLTSTQYVLRADYPVEIGFMSNSNGGSVSVTADGSVLMEGNISNKAGGEVALTSQTGGVVNNGGRIEGNRVLVNAASDIDVLHSALQTADDATVNLSTANGNISFVSNQGNLVINQAATGNAAGAVDITADGSLLNGASSINAAVAGARINLTSNNGTIGAADNALLVQAGTEPISANPSDASVSARAKGDIFLTQYSGDMRIGSIESADGEITLSANGSFINAAENSGTNASNKATRLDRWISHGLVSAQDAADSRTDSAAGAKKIRETAVDTRAYQLALRDTVKADGQSQDDYEAIVASKAEAYKTAAQTLAPDFATDLNDAQNTYAEAVKAAKDAFDNSPQSEADKNTMMAAMEEAFSTYSAARIAYYQSKGYNYTADEAQVVSSYIDLETGNAGWSKNSLLYAMQEEILNSTPGELPSYDKPNVKANKITFANNGTQGGIGELSAPETILMGDLTTEENLKKLSSAQTGELTWNYENGTLASVTIQKESPVVVYTPDSGGVKVQSEGQHVFLATVSPVTDSEGNIEEGSALHILGDINAGTANVKLQAGNGITVTKDNGEAGTITAADLILYAGQGDAGTTEKPIQTDLTGSLDANSAKSVIVHQVSNEHDLTLKSVVAGEAIEITSDKGIEMEPAQSDTVNTYLRASDHINLTALGGGVGKTEAIRVLANEAVVNVAAGSDSQIVGMVNGDDPLTLGSVSVDNGSFAAETENSIVLSSVVRADTEIRLTSEKGSIASVPETNVYLDGGTGLSLQAANGNLGSADNALLIQNRSDAAIDATAQNAWLKGIANTSDENADNMTLRNVRVAGELKADSEGNLRVKEATDENGESITSVEAGTVGLTAEKSMAIDGAVTATSSDVTATAKGDVTTTQAVTANQNVSLTSTDGAIITNSTVTAAEGNVAANADGDITFNGTVTAGKEISLKTATGNIANGTDEKAYLDAGTHVALEAENGNLGSETNALRIMNHSNTVIDAAAQNAWLTGIANATPDDNTMTLQKVRINEVLQAESEGELTVKGATDENGESITSVEAGTVDLTAGKGMAIDGAVTAASGDVIATAKDAVTITQAVKANKNIALTSANGIIRTDGIVTAGENVTAQAKGDVLINNTVDASTAALSAGNDIVINSTITVDTGFTAKAKEHIYETGTGVLQTKSANDQVELEAGRGITFDNENNSFVGLNVHGTENADAPGTYKAIDGNVSVVVNGDREWKVQAPEITDQEIPVKGILATIGSPVNGNITLTNVAQDGTVVLYKNDLIANGGAEGEGSVTLSADKAIVVTQGIQAANNVSVSSNSGNVFVKNSITADKGNVNVSTGEGNLHVGADITSGKDTALTTANGNITVDKTVNSKNGNISLTTGEGNIAVNDKVVSDTGSVTATTGKGNIHIGDNGPDERTIFANRDITVATESGKININGRTAATNGDITLSAKSEAYTPGLDGMNIIIEDNGEVLAAGYVNLKAENGDLHVTDKILSDEGLTAEISKQGSVYFDRSVAVKDDVVITTEKGDIHVDKSVASADGNVSMSTTEGNVHVGASVATANGDISLTAGTGDVSVDNKVVANNGSVTVATGKGDIHIGDNGPDERTVFADQDITVATESGTINIKGRTATTGGDITLSAKSEAYTPGSDGMNIIIEDNGEVLAAGYVNLKAENGDLHVTDKILSGEGLTAETSKQGSVYLDRSVAVKNDVVIATDKGDIHADKSVVSRDGNVSMSTTEGDINAGGTVKASKGNVVVNTGKGDINVNGNLTAGREALLNTTSGDINVGGTLTALNDISVATKMGNISLNDAKAGNNVSLEIKKTGDLKADSVTAGNLVHAKVNRGDIFLDLANGRAVVIDMQDNTSASHIGTIQAKAGGTGSDVALTGKYIKADNIVSKGGKSPLTVDLQAPDGRDLITDVTIGNMSSNKGTVIPKLWAERGNIHVSNGYLAFGDIYTTDKIHADNPGTAFALYGRTPTGDGEPHMYWNNVDLPHRRTALLMTDSNVFTRMVDLLDERTYTWLFERDYLKYVLEPEAPWAKHKGLLIYDRGHIVSGQRENASGRELLSE